jgi:uncharacterized protein (TIGR02271 family)
MTMTFTPDQLTGRTAVDPAGDKIGEIGQVYLDDRTGEPAWVTLSTGLFGSRESFAPLHGASVNGDEVVLRVAKDQVKDAPNVEDDGHLDEGEQGALYDYYGGLFGDDATGSGTRTGGPGHDTSGGNTDDAMTRSEERVHVGTEGVEAGRARLRKYVVTENVTQTVPVSHEEVRVEREPITDANVGAAMDGPEISEEEHEVTLHAERPVVAKEAVPVERVRMDTETVTEEQTVNESVRKEQIDVEGDGGTSGNLR